MTLADTLAGTTLTDAQKAIGELAPEGTATIEYTYTVQQKDVDAGKIENTATATGTDPKGAKVDSNEAKATVTTEEAAGALTVTKEADPTSGVAVGDTVEYTVTVTNSGNVTLTGVTLADTLAGTTLPGPTQEAS